MRKEVGLLGDAQERIEVLQKENSRLRRIVKTFQKAFDIVESILKSRSSWNWMKENLFNGLGKQKYDEFQGFRHENQEDRREKVVNRETGFER